MHILLGILGAVGVIALILYRISAFKQGADDIIDTVERATGAWRRHKFRSKAERPVLETEDDPRAAAAAIAVSIMESSGALTADQEAALRKEFETVLEVDESAELLAYARWLAKDVADPNTISSRIAELLNKELGGNEKQQLIDMLRRLSSDDPVQIQSIDYLKTRLNMGP